MLGYHLVSTTLYIGLIISIDKILATLKIKLVLKIYIWQDLCLSSIVGLETFYKFATMNLSSPNTLVASILTL